MDLAWLDKNLAACTWQSSLDVAVLSGRFDSVGAAKAILPIPNQPRLVGANLYCQGIVLHPQIAVPMTTNGLSISVGR